MSISFDSLDDWSLGGVDSRDSPDFSDAYFEWATANGVELTDDELDQLTEDCGDILPELAYQSFL